jgi:hypothetical protein
MAVGGREGGLGPAQIYDSPQENHLQKLNACNLQNMRATGMRSTISMPFHAVLIYFLYAAKALIFP